MWATCRCNTWTIAYCCEDDICVASCDLLSSVSHYSAIGDIISCDAPIYPDRLQRQAFVAILPLQGMSLACDRPSLRKEVGV